MSLRGNPSVNHHWSASSVLTLHDFDLDEGFQNMDPRLLCVYVMDESNQPWWGRVLSLGSNGTTAKLRVTAPRCFAQPSFPDNGLLIITLVYPSTPEVPKGLWKQVPVQVDYVDDNGCW
jgi:hypothetical protein